MNRSFDPTETNVPEPDTKERILDVAELMFAENGFTATSLRRITAKAQVNLAAVNYHFQTKESLLVAVLRRRTGPMNQRRLELLEAAEREAGEGSLRLEEVVRAFVMPVMEALHSKGVAQHFPKLLARMYADPRGFVAEAFRAEMASVATRFVPAFERSVPEMGWGEMAWGIHFGIGSMAHYLAAGPLLEFLSRGTADPKDFDGALRRLIVFFSGGLRAMAMQTKEAAR